MASGGKKLARPAFADDDGSPDLELRTELISPTDSLIALLKTSRLLVAVVAVAGETSADGSDKSSHLAAVSMINVAGIHRSGLTRHLGSNRATGAGARC